MGNDKSVVSVLKEFGLTDDQILEIVCADEEKNQLGKGTNLLKSYIYAKWQMDSITAMKTVKKLKEELL